jgi:orotidine-5'-phosphate decarboxylase
MKLCIALDLKTNEENLQLLKALKDYDIWVKVGFRSFIRDGKYLINEIKSINNNFNIFLDLKLYDIPNTMADASLEIANLGVNMFNIHASAGFEAMQTVMKKLNNLKKRPIVLAVTALTSFNQDSFKKIYNQNLDDAVINFAKQSYLAGLDGVVCSAFESLKIKEHTSKNFLTLTPGIRPFNEDSNDQKRVADISFAKKNLVDFIVVGRPIYQSNNPTLKVKNILQEIQK